MERLLVGSTQELALVVLCQPGSQGISDGTTDADPTGAALLL